MSPVFLLFLPALLGSANVPDQSAVPAAATAQMSRPPLREVAPGILEYHGIRLDQKNQRISFPATVNQRVGLIEYLLVNEKGKVHESLFSTQVLPHDIHLALLLIGLKFDASANRSETVPPSAIDSAYLQAAPKLKGPPVLLSVAWTHDGKRTEIPAGKWVLNLRTDRAMKPGAWTYNGSLVQNGVFLADEELSIVAVITDPTALVNNPRPGYDDDEIWQLQEKMIPPIDTPLEFSITLAKPDSTGTTP